MPVPSDRVILAAKDRSRRLYAAGGYRTAYVDGARAAHNGHPIDTNPYQHRPGSAGYFRAWQSGYLSVAPDGVYE